MQFKKGHKTIEKKGNISKIWMHGCNLSLGCNKRRVSLAKTGGIYYYSKVDFKRQIGGLWARTAQCFTLQLLQPCVNEANMQTLVWTLVGSLCSSSASLVCCPGPDLPGSHHPHLPENKQSNNYWHTTYSSTNTGKQTLEHLSWRA